METWPKRSNLLPSGKVTADIEIQPLSAINWVFDRLHRGDVPARVVIDFNGALQ